MKDTKKRIFKITFTSILIAMMFALSWTVLGMIPLGLASATTVFIPLAIGIVCLDDYRYTAILGTSFGVVSLIRALSPSGILDPFFLNPLVSVLPRLIAAILTHLCYRGLSKVIKNKMIVSGITGGLLALFNTIFTISFLVLCNYQEIFQMLVEGDSNYGKFLGSIALLNMLPEIALGVILVTVISKIYSKVYYNEEIEAE